MKSIICLFFLLVAGAASVCGQSAPPILPQAPPTFQRLSPIPQALPPAWQGLTPALPMPAPGNNLLLPGHRVGIPPESPLPPLNSLLPQNPIRILRPDNMPCLVPNLSRVERMPVRRMTNADRMLAIPRNP